jgi:hypothetical protein
MPPIETLVGSNDASSMWSSGLGTHPSPKQSVSFFIFFKKLWIGDLDDPEVFFVDPCGEVKLTF